MKTSNILLHLSIYALVFLLSVKAYSQDYIPIPNSGNIYDTKSDIKQRVWIATDHGILLHDGSNFIKINPSQKKYKDASVSSIVSYKNYIYTIFTNGGVIRFETLNFTSKKITQSKVASIVQLDDEHLYLLLEDGTVELHNKGKVIILKKFKTNLDTHPLMFEGPGSTLLVSIPANGLFQINSNDGRVLKDFKIRPTGYNNSFSKFKNRFFFIDKQIVLELSSSGDFKFTNLLKRSENENISFFMQIADQEILLVKNEKNVFFYKQGEKIYFELDKLKNYVVKNILFYNENNFYIGTNQGLRKIINIETRLTALYDTPTQSIDYIRVRRKIIPYQNNKFILIGSPNSYIYNPDNNSYNKISNTDATLYDAVLIDDNVFAGSEGGGVNKINLKSKKLSKIITKDIDSTKLYMSILDARLIYDNTILIGRRGEVIFYNYRSNISESVSIGAGKSRVRALLLDTIHKTIYVATDSGVCLIDYLTKKRVNNIYLKGVEVSDIKLSKYLNKSVLWVASDSGLIAFDTESKKLMRKLPIEQLNYSKIASILIDKTLNIWVATFNGIFAYNPKIDKVLKLINPRQLVNFESNYKSAAVLQDGKLIFGGLNGYDIIDPSLFNFVESPNTGIISYIAFYANNNYVINSFNSATIFYNDIYDNLKIYFTVKNIEYLSYCSFEYQLDNSNWVSLKNETNFYLYKLSDGVHKVNIRGFDELGRPINFEPIVINYQTTFYKKNTFLFSLLFIVIALLILVGWTFYRKVRDERKLIDQIAMDLHDEVGTLLTKAIYILKDEGVKEGDKKLLSYVSDGLYNLRTYINTFKIKNIRSDAFLDEIKEFKKKFLLNTNIEALFDVNYDRVYLISASQYRNLKLISYEIHNNIVKHSKATKMNTSMSASEGVLYIETEDNGIFNDMSILNNNGNGINNLKKRVKQLGGQITFSIADSGSGLNIKIIIKL